MSTTVPPGTKVLVIDDDPLNLKLVKAILRGQDYNVITEPDAEAGYRTAKRERPAVILMDIGLPGLDGVQATRKILSDPDLRNVPIIAIVDTNCDPTDIDYPIPGNDDAIRAITLFTQIIANAVIEADNEIGLEVIETLQDDEDEDLLSETRPESDQDVETVALAATVGEQTEETPASFTAEDYSDYNPDEEEKKPAAEAAEEPAPIVDDTLYEQ